MNTRILNLLLIAIMPAAGLAVDIYAPAMPSIALSYHASAAQIQQTIALYLLGFGGGQLITGPLSDRFGRRRVLASCLFIFFIACGLAPSSPNLLIFDGLRLLQGFAISGQILNVRAIMADHYQGSALRKISIYVTTAWTLSPVIGPYIGALLQTHFNWQATFYFLAAYSFVLFVWVVIFLQETLRQSQHLHYRKIATSLCKLLKHKAFMANVAGLLLGFTLLNVFNVLGPFFVQVQLGYSLVFYSHLAVILGIGCLLGSLSNRLLVSHISMQHAIRYGIVTLFIIAATGQLLVYLIPQSTWLFLPFAFCLTLLIGFLYPNFSANCSALFTEHAGLTAALRGVVSIGGASLFTGLIGFIHLQQAWVLMLVYFVLAILLCGFFSRF